MHCYMYADCKTEGCKGRFWLAHFERPTRDVIYVDYPDEEFPIEMPCPLCGRHNSFRVKDVKTQTYEAPREDMPPGWKPWLGEPDPPKGIN